MKDFAKKYWAIIALTVALAVTCFLFGAYAILYAIEKDENKRQYAELLDVRGELHGLEKDYDERAQINEKNAEARKSLVRENKTLKEENSQLKEDMEEIEKQYRDCRDRLESLDKDYAGTLKKSAHFTITGKAVVKNELTDEEEEIAINEHLLAIPEKNTLPAEFPLLWNSEVINLQLKVTSPEGEVRLNYEPETSITETGAYVVSVLGKDGNYEATVVVGKDHRGIDLTPKMHVTIW